MATEGDIRLLAGRLQMGDSLMEKMEDFEESEDWSGAYQAYVAAENFYEIGQDVNDDHDDWWNPFTGWN